MQKTNIIKRMELAVQAIAVRAAVKDHYTPNWQRRLQAIGPVVLMLTLMAPNLAFAQSQPWETTAENAYDLIMSVARWVSVIGVVACGLAAMFGKLSWDWAGKIVVGLVLIFGGSELVDYFSAGIGGN